MTDRQRILSSRRRVWEIGGGYRSGGTGTGGGDHPREVFAKQEASLSVILTGNRPVSSQDLNALRRASWDQVGDQDWEQVLKHSLGWVGATDGDRLIGFVNVAWDGGVHAFLLDTTVHPDYQRRGIGTALVREAAAMARARGAEWLHVEDELEGFYRGCGFRPTAGLLALPPDAPPPANSTPEADR